MKFGPGTMLSSFFGTLIQNKLECFSPGKFKACLTFLVRHRALRLRDYTRVSNVTLVAKLVELLTNDLKVKSSKPPREKITEKNVL